MSRARDIAAMPGRHDGNKAGLIAFFATATAPDGWLECNGAAVSRTTYADLFAEVGTDHDVQGGDDVLSIGYDELIALLIKSIQQLSARVAELEART